MRRYYRGFEIRHEGSHVIVTDLSSDDKYCWREDTIDEAYRAIDEELDEEGGED